MAPLRAVLVLLASALGLAAPAAASAATYYVSPTGNDAAAGSAVAPWRTLAKVDATTFAPGDTVLFAGGGIWNGTLQPRGNGAAGSPITFGAFGTGRPVLDGTGANGAAGIVVTGSDLAFRGFEIRGWRDGASAVYLVGTHRVLLDDLYVHDVDEGIHPTPSAPSSDLTISSSRIEHVSSGTTGVAINIPAGSAGIVVRDTQVADVADSCIVDQGSGSRYERIDVRHCGYVVTAYGTHDVYLKGPNQTLVDSELQDARTNCVSVRFQGATVTGNRIHGCPVGIGWFEYATAAGAVTIAGNRVWDAGTGIYLDGSSTQSFAITGNTIVGGTADGGQTIGIAAHYVPALQITGNTVSGNLLKGFSIDGTGTYVEGNNTWQAAGPIALQYKGVISGLAAYRAASGQGAGDVDLGAGTGPDVTAPTAPTGLAATRSGTTVTLTWRAATDDRGVVAYRVYAGNKLVQTVTATTATLKAAAGKTATYAVTALDAAGNESAKSATVKVAVTAVAAPRVVRSQRGAIVVRTVAARGAVLVANGRRLALRGASQITLRGLAKRATVRLFVEIAGDRSAVVVAHVA
jgi:hypothetical protein